MAVSGDNKEKLSYKIMVLDKINVSVRTEDTTTNSPVN